MRTKLGQLFFRFLFICLSVGYFTNANAQFDDFFTVVGRLSTDDGNNENVQIRIEKNGVEEQTFTPPRSGRFKFEFEYNNEFLMTFFKDGYYKKMIVVSTHVPLEVLEENSVFPPFQIEVSLVKEIPGIDKSFTNKPAGRVYYNANIDNFDSEVFFSDIQLEEQAAAARSQEQELTEEQRAALAQREQDYKKSIADADAFMQSKKYEEALAKFEYARGLFPERPYPNDRIAELQDLVSALRLAEERRRASDQAYQDKIAEADGLMGSEEYERAKQSYGEALGIRPDDFYATGQIAKADEMIRQQQIDLEYNNLITEAQSAYSNSDLEQAKSLYEEALLLKPEQSIYINEQIQKIENELAAQVELAKREEQYQELMKEGEKEFRRENYQEALVAFRQALTNKPNDDLAQGRVTEVENILLERQKREQYDQFVAQADESFGVGNLAEAKTLYQQALTIFPEEEHPKSRISEIDQRIAIQDQFDQLVSQADQAAEQSSFQVAKGLYQQALAIKDDDVIKEKIQEMDRLIVQAEMDENYAELIANADAAMNSKEYATAKSLYEQALELKNEAYPKSRMKSIVDELALIEKQKQEEYNAAIQRGDDSFEQEDYESAKDAYQQALSIKPEEDYPKEKIAEIEGLQAKLARLTSSYNQAIDEANRLAQQEEYLPAKDKYEEALQYLPDEEYPKKQIEKIDEIIAQIEAEQAREANYQAAVQAGDSLLSLEELQPAKDQFMNALGLKPEEQYPKQKIQEIDAMLAQLERERIAAEVTQKAYNDAIQRGDAQIEDKQYNAAIFSYEEAMSLLPEEQYPKDRIAEIDRIIAQQKEEAFQAAIASGDQLFQEENYTEAKSAYAEALKIKPTDTYTQSQIDEITRILEQMALDLQKREEMEAQYREKVKNADLAFNGSQFEQAKNLYQQANSIKPDEEYPLMQMAKIDSVLLELQKQAEIDQAYDQAMRMAQNAYDSDDLENAISYYQKASELKPGEPMPPQKIAEINDLIAQREELARLAAQEEQQAKAMQAAKQRNYDEALANAQTAFDQKEYASAKNYLVSALNIFPDEQYPKDRIAQIDLLIEQEAQARAERERQAMQDSIRTAHELAFQRKIQEGEDAEAGKAFEAAIARYVEAKEILPERAERVNQRIARVREAMRALIELETNYVAAIKEADRLFNTESWNEALLSYREAAGYKPEEAYPKERIRFIAEKLGDLEKNYQQAVQLADQLFGSESWQQAKTKYEEALNLKPEEQYPQSQLVLVNQKIAEQELAQQAEAEKEQAYREAIAEAEQAFVEGQLARAKGGFEVAKSIKPGETYPDDRIAEIDRLLALRASQEELARQQQEMEQRYQEAIAVADREFGEEDYEQAKVYYNNALAIKPDESYPQNQLNLINQLEREQAVALQESKEEPRRGSQTHISDAAGLTVYDQCIASGNENYSDQNYKVAQYYYQKALNERPNDSYATAKIKEIGKLINLTMSENALADYENAIDKADKAFSNKQYSVAKFYYYKAVEIKSWEQYPKDQLEEIQRLTNSLLSEIKEKEYQDYIAKADEAFIQEDYAVSRAYYNRSLSVKPDEQYPDIRLNEIAEIVEKQMNSAQEKEYNNFISEADEAMRSNNYSIARFYYQKALGVKPNEKYPREQLKAIRKSLGNKASTQLN